ncbi:unnamed protein product, partial [Strongylus vulgaris]
TFFIDYNAQQQEEAAEIVGVEDKFHFYGYRLANPSSQCEITTDCEESDEAAEYNRIGLFREIDLESDHRDFLVDIVKYAFSKQACYPITTATDWLSLGGYRAFTITNLFLIEIFYNDRLATEVLPLSAYLVAMTVSKRKICRDQLEVLSVAAVRLASKIESQYALNPEMALPGKRMVKVVKGILFQICRATDFQLHRCSALFFMRIIQKLVERHSWQWKFAKIASQLACCQMELAMLRPTLLAGVVMRLCCLLVSDDEWRHSWQWKFAKIASQLACCQMELAMLRPTLLAGVVMRLCCLLVSDDEWPKECYAILGEPIEDYDEPHAILCRLILTVRVEDAFAEAYVRFHHTIERALSSRPGWIEEQSAAANKIKMLGNHTFHK